MTDNALDIAIEKLSKDAKVFEKKIAEEIEIINSFKQGVKEREELMRSYQKELTTLRDAIKTLEGLK